MKIRFLADANLNQRIVSGLLLREPAIDFALPQGVIPDGMSDLEVLELGASLGRVIVSHDVRTMPAWFQQSVEARPCPGLILVPEKTSIRDAIEDLFTIWQSRKRRSGSTRCGGCRFDQGLAWGLLLGANFLGSPLRKKLLEIVD